MLFDFDGVLANTMEDNYQAWVYALGLHGATLSKLEYFLWEGQRVSHIASEVLQRYGRDPSLGAQVAISKDEYYNQHNNFAWHVGARELVASLLASQIKVAVVSGASRLRLVTPNTTEFLSTFHALICADDCKLGKPAPEPYLLAAERLGCAPTECVVVENAPSGIESAKAANMYCIAVCSTLSPAHLARADRIFPTLQDLLEDPILRKNSS